MVELDEMLDTMWQASGPPLDVSRSVASAMSLPELVALDLSSLLALRPTTSFAALRRVIA
jgi:hypothetical protein